MLTHQRPKLFERCLASIKRVAPKAEVIVNCDSDDVVADNRARYYFEVGPLNDLYQFVVERASGTHIWFVEDDDVALSVPRLSDIMTVHKYIMHDNTIASTGLDHADFQLSQCCIPKHLLDFSCIETECNCIFNDWHLVKNVPYIKVPKIIFRQTYNADNISFAESPMYRGKVACNSCKWRPPAMKLE